MKIKLYKKSKQKGIFIVDAMIGLIIFTIGVLGILKFQGETIVATSQSQYRITASFLADSLINSMWLERDKVATFTSNNPSYNNWLTQVNNNLPGSLTNEPVVTITDEGNNIYHIQVEIKWRSQSGHLSSHKISSTIY